MVKREIIEKPLYTDEDEIIKGYIEELDGIVYDKLWLTFNKKSKKILVKWERFVTDSYRTYYLNEENLNGMVELIKKFKESISDIEEK